MIEERFFFSIKFMLHYSSLFLVTGSFLALSTFSYALEVRVEEKESPLFINKNLEELKKNPKQQENRVFSLSFSDLAPEEETGEELQLKITSNFAPELLRTFEFASSEAEKPQDNLIIKNPLSSKTPKKTASITKPTSKNYTLKGPFSLKNPLEFTLELDPNTPLSGRLQIECLKVKTQKGSYSPEKYTPLNRRMASVVRKPRENNIASSRIPGLVRAKNGTIITLYDARYKNSQDLQGEIDIAIQRSEDNGQTWQEPQIVLSQKNFGGLPPQFNGVSDACILLDNKTGKLYALGLWMHGVLDKEGKWIENITEKKPRPWAHQWGGKASQPGTSPKETCQLLLTESTDNGKTWSTPRNLTPEIKPKDWWLLAPSPGSGITMKDGTLVFPSQGRNETGMCFSNLIYSKDGGKTWNCSTPAYTNTTESSVVELDPGTLMLNMRNNRNRHEKGDKNGRAIFTTKDMGQTWQVHPSSENALIEPVCMGALIKHGTAKTGDRLFFSNPNSKIKREKMTIKASADNGTTWSEGLLLNEGSSAYSSLTGIESAVGIFYEIHDQQIIFQVIPLKDIP